MKNVLAGLFLTAVAAFSQSVRSHEPITFTATFVSPDCTGEDFDSTCAVPRIHVVVHSNNPITIGFYVIVTYRGISIREQAAWNALLVQVPVVGGFPGRRVAPTFSGDIVVNEKPTSFTVQLVELLPGQQVVGADQTPE